jgi:hypothetical protein
MSLFEILVLAGLVGIIALLARIMDELQTLVRLTQSALPPPPPFTHRL